MVKAIRGATTAIEKTKKSIIEATEDLLRKMIDKNNLETENIISIIFTATADLAAEFPARAARRMGLTNTPLLCCQELSVNGSLQKCIRILMHVNDLEDTPKHIYLNDAKFLRTDLVE